MSTARTITKTTVLTAKRDLLEVTAKQYAFGAATLDDLQVAAVEFSEALADKACENIRGGK